MSPSECVTGSLQVPGTLLVPPGKALPLIDSTRMWIFATAFRATLVFPVEPQLLTREWLEYLEEQILCSQKLKGRAKLLFVFIFVSFFCVYFLSEMSTIHL